MPIGAHLAHRALQLRAQRIEACRSLLGYLLQAVPVRQCHDQRSFGCGQTVEVPQILGNGGLALLRVPDEDNGRASFVAERWIGFAHRAHYDGQVRILESRQGEGFQREDASPSPDGDPRLDGASQFGGGVDSRRCNRAADLGYPVARSQEAMASLFATTMRPAASTMMAAVDMRSRESNAAFRCAVTMPSCSRS